MSQLNVNNITKYTGGEVVVNDASEDVDFRVESNDDANMLVVNAGNNSVGVGVATPSAKFEVEDGGTSLGDVLVKITIDDQSSHYGLSVGNDSHSTTDNLGLMLMQDNSGNGSIYNNGHNPLYFHSSGEVTKPTQPAFLVTEDGGGQSITNAVQTTITLDSEIFDVGANFASNTFTAPVTGKYLITGQVITDAGSTPNTLFGSSLLQFVASNRTWQFRSPNIYTSENDRFIMKGTAIVDMDASDTCLMDFFASRSGASGATTIYNNGTVPNTFLSGYLLG